MTWSSPSVDADALRTTLSDALGEPVTDTAILGDGLNLVVAVTTVGERPRYVLRRPNKLRHTALFTDLRTEYAVLDRLEPTAIPAPEPVLFRDDESMLGDAFVVTTYLDGETVQRGDPLPERFRTAAGREALADGLVETLAAIHAVDTGPFESVCDRQSASRQVAHAVDRLDAVRDVTDREFPTLREVAGWLDEHAPAHSETTLVHGDFRPGNVLFSGDDRPTVTGVVDWETAMLGDPLTELGYLLLDWRDGEDPRLPLGDLEARYPDADLTVVHEMNDHGLSPFTTDPGSPTRREVVAHYESLTGRTFDHERFYRALAAFVMGVVWADLHRFRVETGAASDFEPMVEYVGLLASAIADGDVPL
ncbi:phosphotransferase family protein [Halomarina oriensis]|uniref:Phosphotransferase n=1 Tax=Halomarina oriensis TaxID=671145 RepID=A0A6B0GJR7_9EURY|nr:phosphotransferase family protein [Halomarina oriensis]MWG34101.1 phosphotransferase [Halomarina oriensis]